MHRLQPPAADGDRTKGPMLLFPITALGNKNINNQRGREIQKTLWIPKTGAIIQTECLRTLVYIAFGGKKSLNWESVIKVRTLGNNDCSFSKDCVFCCLTLVILQIRFCYCCCCCFSTFASFVAAEGMFWYQELRLWAFSERSKGCIKHIRSLEDVTFVMPTLRQYFLGHQSSFSALIEMSAWRI